MPATIEKLYLHGLLGCCIKIEDWSY